MANIQWYPGHMAKARREASEKIKLVDVVIELVDARIPESSQNPIIQEIIQDKAMMRVLNKADLAEKNVTQAWLKTYQEQGIPAYAIDAQHNKGIKQLESAARDLMEDYFFKQRAKGIKDRPIRLMILGIPNVGKSTLINRFVGKNQAQTGDRPGVTRAQRWLKIGKDFELLDTPGILWPKFEDPDVAKKLALTGAIKDSLIHMDDLALYLLDFLVEDRPQVLVDQYLLSDDQVNHLDLPQLLIEMTNLNGFREDFEAMSQRLILDMRQGKLGPISLDRPEASKAEE